MKKVILYSLLSFLPLQAMAQPKAVRELKKILNEYFENYEIPGYHPYRAFETDSLHLYPRARKLDIYPNEAFYSQPFTPERVKQLEKDIKNILPKNYRKYQVTIYGKFNRPISVTIPNALRDERIDKDRMWGNLDYDGQPWVTNASRPYSINNGLQGRHLMVTPSHGRYYKFGKWHWQRPYLFSTCEDLFTKSYVNPYIIPMLENAGAVVCSARERDIQTHEAIVDNDPLPLTKFEVQPKGAIEYVASMGTYLEDAKPNIIWNTVSTKEICPLPQAAQDTLPEGTLWAFAMPSKMDADSINPFRLGTARKIKTTSKSDEVVTTSWTPRIPETGRYGVYVSYATLPNSVEDAHYTVYHNGGKTEFIVNQKMGGGTWLYLGTFDFSAGLQKKNRVVLSNYSKHKGVVTADAVRFGGGMGRIARSVADTSNLPAFMEAARYYAQWSGMPDSLFMLGDPHNDYNDDIRTRSSFMNYLGGGSIYMPDTLGLKVPIELGLGVHSDAGIRRDSTIYGTMSICTSVKQDTIFNYRSGLSRLAAMDLSSELLNSITHDLTQKYKRVWTRRELWDRNYGESRTPEVPSVILEMLSHQNFEDLKYGHDPNFKFDLSRAVYKAILRYVNFQHGNKDVAVQPLPVRNFSAVLHKHDPRVTLSWKPTIDLLEESAEPQNYVLYTRTADEAFDNGQLVGNNTEVTLSILPNIRYDFKIAAVNEGGESFPSEVLSVYYNPSSQKEILIVNGFERLAGPARLELPDSVGFDLNREVGVPYQYTAAYCGAQIDFNPAFQGQEGPGALGYSGTELLGKVIAGNTFDYTAEHGRAIAACGRYSYSSMSREALEEQETDISRFKMIDYIAGLQKHGRQDLRYYKTFTDKVQELLKSYLYNGGNLLVSGSYIGSDMQMPEERKFTHDILKYAYAGTALSDSTQYVNGLNLNIPIYRKLNSKHYAAQAPDILMPTSAKAFTAFIYGGGYSAGIAYPGKDYRVLSMGFPFECISHPVLQQQAMDAIIRFLIE